MTKMSKISVLLDFNNSRLELKEYELCFFIEYVKNGLCSKGLVKFYVVRKAVFFHQRKKDMLAQDCNVSAASIFEYLV